MPVDLRRRTWKSRSTSTPVTDEVRARRTSTTALSGELGPLGNGSVAIIRLLARRKRRDTHRLFVPLAWCSRHASITLERKAMARETAAASTSISTWNERGSSRTSHPAARCEVVRPARRDSSAHRTGRSRCSECPRRAQAEAVQHDGPYEAEPSGIAALDELNIFIADTDGRRILVSQRQCDATFTKAIWRNAGGHGDPRAHPSCR